MNKLALCKDLHKDMKQGPGVAGQLPTSTTGQTDPMLIGIVSNIEDAYKELQNKSKLWKFRFRREMITLPSGAMNFNLRRWFELDIDNEQAAFAAVDEGDSIYFHTAAGAAFIGTATLLKKATGHIHVLLSSDMEVSSIVDDITIYDDAVASNLWADVDLSTNSVDYVFDQWRWADDSSYPFIEMYRIDAPTVSSPIRVYYDDYSSFRYWANFDWALEAHTSLSFPSGSPTLFTMDLDDATIAFNQSLDVAHQIILHFRRPIHEMASDTAEPIWREDHHKTIVHLAHMMWAETDEHNRRYQSIAGRFRTNLGYMRRDLTPRVKLISDEN